MIGFRTHSHGSEAYIMLGRREIHVWKARDRNHLELAEHAYISAWLKATPRQRAEFETDLARFRAEAVRWEASN